jgi:hypothetical protein
VAGLLELVDRVDLPGQVVQADTAAPLGCRVRSDAEQTQVVMVA